MEPRLRIVLTLMVAASAGLSLTSRAYAGRATGGASMTSDMRSSRSGRDRHGPIGRMTASASVSRDGEIAGDFPVWLPLVLRDGMPIGGEEIGATPTTTVTPTPSSVPEMSCRQIMVNGDFEQGPDVGWAVESNGQIRGEEIAPKHVIRNNDEYPDYDPAFEGEWVAILGGISNFDFWEVLYQATPVPLIDQTRIVTATLRYMVRCETAEVPNGIHNDKFGAVAMNETDSSEVISGTFFSEETIEPDQWVAVSVDVTRLMTARPGWSTIRIAFRSELDSALSTIHLVDAARLDVCETGTEPDHAPSSP